MPALTNAPRNRSGACVSPLTFMTALLLAPQAATARVLPMRSWNSANDKPLSRPRVSTVRIDTSLSGSSNGTSLMTAALKMAKTELLTAMPSANATMAAMLKRRSLTSMRTAKGTSCEMSWSAGEIHRSRT